jgi:hypothetical protein
MKNTFEQLSALNLAGKTEKRGNLTYLSWANAWHEAKKLFPDVQRKVYESETGMNYHTDGHTAWVKVGVTINGLEHIDYLPVMNHMNKSILLENITSFEVNKTIQRSTVKALALHGLALNIYAKEDFPELGDSEVAKKPATQAKAKPTNGLITLAVGDANWTKVSNYIIDNIGLRNEDIIKNLSKKYVISKEVEKEIANLRK